MVLGGGRVARIFLSHAREDLALAVWVRDWLRDQRHQVFLDRDLHEGISVGEAWKQRLYRELRAADAVVCVVTATYTKSPWCAAEIGIADALGSRLLPLQAEPGVTWRLLDSLQYADFAGDRDRALSELASTLRGIDAAGGSGWADDRSPFPGLRPFDVGMARAFCGRGEETRRLTSR